MNLVATSGTIIILARLEIKSDCTFGRVAERYTQRIQNPRPLLVCGFESHLVYESK